jgi:hypothetical protein
LAFWKRVCAECCIFRHTLSQLMSQSHKEPFNPFKADKNLVELDFRLNDILSHICGHLISRFGSRGEASFGHIELPEESLIYQYHLSYDQFENFSKVFEGRELGTISDELANELILFSVLPLFYNDVLKARIKHLLEYTKGKLNLYVAKKNVEIGKGKNAKVRLPHLLGFLGSNVDLTLLFNSMILSQSDEDTYEMLEKHLSQGDINLTEEERGKEFLKNLGNTFNFFRFIEKNLPSRSIFEMIIIRHLDSIIRQEKLVDDINTDTKTDARITRFIVDLFRAGGYYLEDTEQDQIRMVNNAYHRGLNKNYRNQLEKMFDYN